MTPECLLHRLSPEERERFNSSGYLVVEDALDGPAVAGLIEAVDRIDARERKVENRTKLLSFPNIVHEDEAFVNLIDCPRTLPRVWGILGWNIYLYHSHL